MVYRDAGTPPAPEAAKVLNASMKPCTPFLPRPSRSTLELETVAPDETEVPPPKRLPDTADKRPVIVFVLALVFGCVLAFLPLWPPLLLAAWVAILAHPIHRRLARVLRGSERAAGVTTVLLMLVVLVPIALTTVSLGTQAVNLGKRVLTSEDGRQALQTVVSGGKDEASWSGTFDLSSISSLVRQHGAAAWRTASVIAGATAKAVIGTFVFVLGTYTFLVYGGALYRWILEHAPLERKHTGRFAAAFAETGRGLFIGVGLTALLQGIAATISYFVLGIPQAAVLGALTVIAALIPAGGAALVWAPVALGLALTDRPGAAVALLIVGTLISTIDNLVRPALSRSAKLDLPMFVLLVAMLGGITIFGAWGLLLGPLLTRLALEGVRILNHEEPPPETNGHTPALPKRAGA